MLKKNKIEIIVILDNIRSMHNIGSIFRTADAIGCIKIFLCGICATPPNKEINKTALGSTESINWKYFSNTKQAIELLTKQNYEIISVEQTKNSVPLKKFKISNNKIALIFGNEVKGVSNEVLSRSNKHVEITQYGLKKSMNVSVAAGIVLWAIKNQTN